MRFFTSKCLHIVFAAGLVLAACTPQPTTGPGPGAEEPTAKPTEVGDSVITPAEPAPTPAAEPAATPAAEPAANAAPGQGEPCAEGVCAKGFTCVEYYGIAGPNGPKFTSCEIPCAGGAACPEGQKCVTIADGPGQVCR